MKFKKKESWQQLIISHLIGPKKQVREQNRVGEGRKKHMQVLPLVTLFYLSFLLSSVKLKIEMKTINFLALKKQSIL